MSDQEVRRKLTELAHAARALEKEAAGVLNGFQVRVVGDFNGQPYGTSRPSLRGKVFDNATAILDGGRVWIALSGEHACARLDDVEFFAASTREEGK